MPARHNTSGRTPDRIKDRPTWLISGAFARSSALLNEGFDAGGDGLRGYHYRLLAALDQWGPASQADLGRDTGIDRSDVTAALAELEGRSLVTRHVDPARKTRKIVSITAEGIRRLHALDGVLDGIQDAVLAPLTAAQQRDFLRLLARLT